MDEEGLEGRGYELPARADHAADHGNHSVKPEAAPLIAVSAYLLPSVNAGRRLEVLNFALVAIEISPLGSDLALEIANVATQPRS